MACVLTAPTIRHDLVTLTMTRTDVLKTGIRQMTMTRLV